MKDLTKLHKIKPKEPATDLNFAIDEDNHLTEKTDENDINKPTKRFEKLRQNKIGQFIERHYILSGLVLTILAIVVALALTTKLVDKPVAVINKKTIAPKPTIYYSPLTGIQVTKAESQLPVTGVMIENSDGARPQSGLSQAGVVFEALAEGGITRFLAIFQEGQPASIGPIRSARPYFIDWDLAFDASYVHVGGSQDALTQIQTDSVKDINEFSYGSSFIRSADRQAPHNVYTSMSTLLSLETSLGYGTSKFSGFPRKVDQPTKVPTASNINFSLSYADFAVNYVYVKTTNSYLRSEAGTPMIDANTNLQLDPKVVIAMVVPWVYGALDSSGANYVDYSDIGSGSAYIFQDGIVTQTDWTKASPTSQIVFTTLNNLPITLNTGQTWITAVDASSAVTYQ
jgi:hypothetical protein